MEKIWDLEIQLTALLWNKSSSSPWPRCRQAAEPTATLKLEAGIRGGDQGARGELPEWRAHLQPRETVLALIPGVESQRPPRLAGAAVSRPGGSGGAPSKEEEEDQRRQAVDSVCLLSAAPTSAPDTGEVPKARMLGGKRANPGSAGLTQTQALPLPSGRSEPAGGERAALKKTGF